jgi:hypothetical protein
LLELVCFVGSAVFGALQVAFSGGGGVVGVAALAFFALQLGARGAVVVGRDGRDVCRVDVDDRGGGDVVVEDLGRGRGAASSGEGWLAGLAVVARTGDGGVVWYGMVGYGDGLGNG